LIVWDVLFISIATVRIADSEVAELHSHSNTLSLLVAMIAPKIFDEVYHF